jgi:hypothetical protein
MTAAIAFALSLAAAEGPTAPSPGEFDAALVRETVESLAAIVDREYQDAEVAARVGASLKRSLAEGRYARVGTAEGLRAALNDELFTLTRDKHLTVALAQGGGSAGQDGDESRALAGRRSNFGVRRVEVLSGNVGYLEMTLFYRPAEAREAISAAMRLLQNADALILDMRQNGGGSPGTVALLASYLFDAPGLPLFEIVPRREGGGRYATETAPLPERNGRPVYVLTARGTFSAGEGLAFLLQECHRGEVIGETTAGAANPGRPYPVNARFTVTVPNGSVRMAATGRNWEGVGVVPDVAVPAADALRVAHERALRQAPRGQP